PGLAASWSIDWAWGCRRTPISTPEVRSTARPSLFAMPGPRAALDGALGGVCDRSLSFGQSTWRQCLSSRQRSLKLSKQLAIRVLAASIRLKHRSLAGQEHPRRCRVGSKLLDELGVGHGRPTRKRNQFVGPLGLGVVVREVNARLVLGPHLRAVHAVVVEVVAIWTF